MNRLADDTRTSPAGREPGTHPMELRISWVLRVGVTLAGAIVLLGLVWYFVQPPAGGRGSLATLQDRHAAEIEVSWTSIVDGIRHGDPLRIIELGLIVLILTPMTRVALMLVLFLMDRDRIFSLVTAIVLAVLLLGFLGLIG